MDEIKPAIEVSDEDQNKEEEKATVETPAKKDEYVISKTRKVLNICANVFFIVINLVAFVIDTFFNMADPKYN